jgi:DNA-binding transcriptional LysR family regulator
MAAFLSACASFVPAAIGAFSADHPGVDVQLDQQEPPSALPRLVAGELDVVVAYVDESSHVDPRLESVKLGDDPYRVVVHPQHRLARRREVRIANLEGERLNGPRPVAGGVAYRLMLERLCREAGFAPDFAYVVDDVTVARAFVAAGLSIAVMPEMTIPHPRPDVVVKPLRGVDPFRTVHAFWLRGRRTPALAPMVAALRGAAAERL